MCVIRQAAMIEMKLCAPSARRSPATAALFQSLRLLACMMAVLNLAAGQASAQTASAASATTTTNPPPELEAAEPKWTFSASVETYVIPDGQDYAQPTVTADRDWLHLEARYNYEALHTGSAWLGYNFAGGKKLEWAITPMVGGVFGDMYGVAPGYEGTLTWWKLELYSQGEYVFDTADSSASFFYNWSTLSLAPVDWFHFGLVAQRTHTYQTNRDIQRGPLVGFTYKRVDVTAYFYNIDESHPTYSFAISLSF
jgi:hypothetical protein